MAGKSIKNLAICQARVMHLLQPKAKVLECMCKIVNLTPNHQQIQIIVEQLTSFLISNFQIKFLKKKDPTNQPRLSILLAKQITKCCMISEHYHLCTNEVRPKFVTSKHHSKHLLLSCCIIQLSFIQCLACIVYGPKQFVSLLS